MSADENNRELSTNFQNDIFTIAAAGTITLNMGAGTDTATVRYLGLPKDYSYGIEIFPTVACSVLEVNGKPMKAAISIPVTGYIAKYGKFRSIKIQAGAQTTVEVGGKC